MVPKLLIATILREQGSETGIQTHIHEFKNYISENGVDAPILTPFSSPKFLVVPVFAVRRLLDRLSSRLSVWWYYHFHYLFLRAALKKELVAGELVCIYAQCPISARAALSARKNSSQKVVMAVKFNKSLADEWVWSGKLTTSDWVYRWIRGLESETLPALDGLIFVSRFMQAHLTETIPGTKAVKSIVLPNFVSTPPARTETQTKRDLISIGTLEPRKNQGYLLRVLSEARDLGYTYSLTLIGDGPSRRKLEQLAEELGVERQVTFMGFQTEAAQYLDNHRAYVHSSLIENLPLVLIEALAHGLPILAGRVGGIPEIVDDRVEGAYWPLDAPYQGALKLIALLEHEETYELASKAARKRFQSQFETSVVAGQFADFLLNGIRASTPPRAARA